MWGCTRSPRTKLLIHHVTPIAAWDDACPIPSPALCCLRAASPNFCTLFKARLKLHFLQVAHLLAPVSIFLFLSTSFSTVRYLIRWLCFQSHLGGFPVLYCVLPPQGAQVSPAPVQYKAPWNSTKKCSLNGLGRDLPALRLPDFLWPLPMPQQIHASLQGKHDGLVMSGLGFKSHSSTGLMWLDYFHLLGLWSLSWFSPPLGRWGLNEIIWNKGFEHYLVPNNHFFKRAVIIFSPQIHISFLVQNRAWFHDLFLHPPSASFCPHISPPWPLAFLLGLTEKLVMALGPPPPTTFSSQGP